MVVLTSAFGTTQSVIESMKLGAYDFIRKESLPFNLKGGGRCRAQGAGRDARGHGVQAATHGRPAPGQHRGPVGGDAAGVQDDRPRGAQRGSR